MTILGQTAAETASYTRALLGGAPLYFRFLQMTLSHVVINTLDPMKIDGQINIVDGASDGVTRTLQMGFIDPDHALRLDSDTPTEGMGGLDRLVRVDAFVYSDLGRWLSAPAFTGRPSVLSRDGDQVTVEAQGKECLHLNKVAPYSIAKGTNVVAAIRSILARNGEVRFRFPSNYRNRLAAVVHVGGADEKRVPWRVAFRLAKSIGLHLYHDATGVPCLRRLPATASWGLYETGENANLISRPKLTTDLTTIRNRVLVTGRTIPAKKGAAAKPLNSDYAYPPTSHPFHPNRLLVNGHPWTNTEFYDVPTLHTKAALNAYAKARLRELLIENIGFEGTAMPWWHSAPQDLLAVHETDGLFYTRLNDGSFPLGPSGEPATVGYTFRVRSPKAGRLRR